MIHLIILVIVHLIMFNVPHLLSSLHEMSFLLYFTLRMFFFGMPHAYTKGYLNSFCKHLFCFAAKAKLREESPIPAIQSDRDEREHLEEQTITSWKDVTEFSYPYIKGRKRKRHGTGASDISTTSTRTLDLHELLEGERDNEIMSLDDTTSSEEGFGERPDDLPNFDDWTCSSPMSVCDQVAMDEKDIDKEKPTLYELSYSSIESGSSHMNKEFEDTQILTHGLALSERCMKKLCTSTSRKKKFEYEKQLPKEELRELCRRQPSKFKICKLLIESSHGAAGINTNPRDEIKRIEISGRSKCGKSYTDDIVVVELLKDDKLNDTVIPRLKIDLSKNAKKESTFYGKVRGVLERKRHKDIHHPVFVCTLDDFQNYLMKPLCKTIPKIKVHQRHCDNDFQVEIYDYDAENGELKFKETKLLDLNMKKAYVFLVALIDWEDQYPSGVILKMFRGNNSSSQESLRLQHQVPFLFKAPTVFAVSSIMAEMPSEPSVRYTKDRLDLTDKLKIFTIDPAGSRDLDDALSIVTLDDGLYEIGVHIADVTSIVRKNDAVDKEAFERATTFYPGQGSRPYHMLPEPISTNLCSLQPGKNRLALSTFFRIGKDGKLKQTPVIKKTVIRSCQQYTYEEVERIIDGEEDGNSKELRLLSAVTREMRKIRLDDRRFAFPVESDMSDESDSVLKTLQSHALVEELMILCNLTIANRIQRYSKEMAASMIIRCQNAPAQEQVDNWMKNFPYIANFVMNLQKQPIPSKQRILIGKDESVPLRYRNLISLQKWVWNEMVQALDAHDFKKVARLVGTDGLHPEQAVAYEEWISFMETAEYKCLGFVENPKLNGVHFSLSLFPYTHFTSPLRRYADIVTHRLVHAILDNGSPPYTPQETRAISEHLNEVTKRAKQFQKQCQILTWGLKLKNKPVVAHGFVQRVSDKELVVCIPGMRNLPKNCREIPLNALNVSSRPALCKDTDSDRDILTLTWQRRIYSATGFCIRYRYQRNKKFETQRIDPHQRTVFHQMLKWRNITREILDEKYKRLGSAFRNPDTPDVNMEKSVKACFNTETDVSSEVPRGNIVKQKCSYSMSFNHAQVLALQLSAEHERGILVPTVQLLDLTQNVKCCLQHTQNPVKVFTMNSTVSTKSKYTSPVEYIQTWLPLVVMEAATKAVENDAATINDLYVIFETGGGTFSLRNSFCERRDINLRTGHLESILLGRNKASDEDEDETPIEYVTSSDYLCIRCEVSPEGEPIKDRSMSMAPSRKKFWIGHARIDKIKRVKKSGKINVHFELTRDSPMPYTSMIATDVGVQCSVDVIGKTDDDRYIYFQFSIVSTSNHISCTCILLGT